MIRYFVRHPTAANLLMAGLLLLGLTSIGGIKRETFPEFTLNYISATVVYPGASPIEAEQNLCLRMEDAVDGLSNIDEVECRASEGVATLVLELSKTADVSRMLVDVQTEINAINDFPAEIEPPTVQQLDWAEPVIDLVITADTDWPGLKAYAEQIKRRLKLDAGVALVDVSGFSDHQLRIELKEAAIRRLGLSVADVASAVERQNLMLPSGNIETRHGNLLIRFDERRVTPEGLAQLVISSNSDGSLVRLGDVATIEDRFELDEEHTYLDGTPAAVLKISKNKADDALRIKELVQAFVDEERLRVPDGVNLTLSNDLSSLLWDRLTMMVNNGGQGIVLVFAVMWLFFSLRYSFWVAAGLPVAFLGGFFMMSVLGLSINVMSLVGLLMAIGIMMDDAIVIAESIAAHMERGDDVDDAVVAGVKKVLPGVISSFLTTVCIFGGLLFLDGQMGSVLKAVPQVLLLVLALSLVEAFLILPAHLAHSLHKGKDQEGTDKAGQSIGFKARFLDRFDAFRNGTLVRWVDRAVRWRYATLGLVFLALFSSFALLAGGVLKFIAFPELDGDVAEARVILPPGAPLSQTQAVVRQIRQAAYTVAERYEQGIEEGEPLLLNLTEQFNANQDAGETGPHLATVRLDLASAETRATLIEDFIADWRSEVGELADPVSLVFTQPSMGPAGRAIELRLKGDDLDQLKAASVAVQQYLGQFNGVNDLLDDMRPGKQEILVTLKPGAEALGVDGQRVASQLRAAYYGITADEIQVGPENLEVHVQLDKQEAAELDGLARFPVILADGSAVPLATVANLGSQRSYVRIQRVDGLRTVTVMGDVDTRLANSAEILRQLRTEFLPQLEAEYPDLRIDFEGEAKESAKTGSSMAKGFLIGLFGVYAILSFQFRSYLEPVVVMLAIPLALIGVYWGHLLLGHSLSMPSMMGYISLAGVVVNDSILLVQYIRHHLDAGEPMEQAVVQASRERFRAVVLTSVTTAAGLLPLLLETSLQAQIVKPLVISIVFGIFTSTLLVLFVIPAAYAVLADRGWVHLSKRGLE